MDRDNEKYAPIQAFGDLEYGQSLENRDLEKACVAFTKAGYAQKVGPCAFVPKQIGNMYTAAVWAGLASLISEVDSETLQGKRVLLYSYGSGLAASMISFRIVDNTTSIKQTLNLRERLAARVHSKPEDFAEVREKHDDGDGFCKNARVMSNTHVTL